MSDADIDRLGDSLCRNVAAQAAQAAQVSQPQPVHWMVKVERRPEKKFLLGFKMPKQAAPVMQGANCTLANIISTTLCNTIQLQLKSVLYALFFITILTRIMKKKSFHFILFVGIFCSLYKTRTLDLFVFLCQTFPFYYDITMIDVSFRRLKNINSTESY